MLAKVKTLGLIGIQGFDLVVEADLNNGLPKFDIRLARLRHIVHSLL